MPSERIDWQAVEAWLAGTRIFAELRAKMGGDPVPVEVDAALRAVRAMRAMEEKRIVALTFFAAPAPSTDGVWCAETPDEAMAMYPTPLEAIEAALDAQEGR